MKRGLFITFEGTEGSGKTTQAELLAEWLEKRDPVLVREPGGTELSEQIRDVLLYRGLEIDPEAEMYLFMASRRQLIAEVITPPMSGPAAAPIPPRPLITPKAHAREVMSSNQRVARM